MNLQEFLDHLASDADTPAALAALDADSIASLQQEVQDAFGTLHEGELTSETIAEMERLADANDALSAETERRDAETAEAAQKAAALAARMGRKPEGDDEADDAEGDAGDGTTGGDGTTARTGTEPGDDDGGDDTDDGGGSTTTGEPAPAEAGKELVNAAARRAPLSQIRRATKTPKLPARGRATITAAADVPGVSQGRTLDMNTLAAAAERRFAGFPQGRANGTVLKAGIAMIEKPFPKDLIQNNGGDENALLAAAADQSRLPGNSLVAAGGWCAPSETLYDLCEPETTDGLVTVPEVAVRRGGIRFAESPSFADIYAGVGFIQTEVQNIAGTEKDCYEIGCPDFTEVRLDAIGLCITAGILQQRGYPEMVQRVIRGAMTAHVHKRNAYVISKMAALSTAVTPTLDGFGAFSDALAALELQVVDQRYKFRLAQSSTVEGVAPAWLKPIFRNDLARRNAVDDTILSVSDAQLDQFLRDRGIAMQWVVDWQDAFVNAGNTGMGATAAATVWPTTAKVLIYPAGTFVVGTADIIQLDAIYDSTNIRTNNYTALFTEEGVLVARRCMQSRLVTLTELCAAGRTGAQIAFDCTP